MIKFTIKKATLEGAAKMLSRVINPKNALPILSTIKCEVKGNEMMMEASDTDISLTTKVELEEPSGEGLFCLPAKLLVDALAQLVSQPVTATINDKRMTLQYQSGETSFPTYDAEEYPSFQFDEKDTDIHQMVAEEVREALKRSVWATSNDVLRPIMSGVYLCGKEEYTDIVASDGMTMVRNRISDGHEGLSLLIPKKVAVLLTSLLYGEVVKIEANENLGRLSCGDYTIAFRQIEGKYVNYNSVIPKKPCMIFTANRARLMNVVRNVIPFASETSDSRLIQMDVQQDKVTVKGENFDASTSAFEGMPVEHVKEFKNGFSIGFSGSRMLAVLSKMPGESVSISMTSPSHPILVTLNEEKETDITMSLMPMIVNS